MKQFVVANGEVVMVEMQYRLEPDVVNQVFNQTEPLSYAVSLLQIVTMVVCKFSCGISKYPTILHRLYSDMKVYYMLFLCLTIHSCDSIINEQKHISSTSAKAENVVEKLFIDSVFINLGTYSGVGKFSILNRKITFIDQIFQTIAFLNQDLNVQGIYLGRGAGPHEVDNVHYAVNFEDSKYLVIDNFGYHKYLNDSIKEYFKVYDWDNTVSTQELMNNPNGEQKGIYGIDWRPDINSNFTAYAGDYLFLPIITEHPKLNAFQHESFYDETFSIGKFRISDGKLVQMGGQWPSVYLNHSFIPNLVGLDLAEMDQGVLASYHIDSLMHVYDEDLQLVEKFGVGGKGFRYDYRTTKTIEEAIDNWFADLEDQSFYAGIYVHEDLVFRVYHPNGKSGETRLQIYRDKILTHDVQVPSRFRVIGKIGDYFYADGHVSELDESLYVYRFQLNE